MKLQHIMQPSFAENNGPAMQPVDNQPH